MGDQNEPENFMQNLHNPTTQWNIDAYCVMTKPLVICLHESTPQDASLGSILDAMVRILFFVDNDVSLRLVQDVNARGNAMLDERLSA